MRYQNQFRVLQVVGLFFILTVFSGCDKIPFLSQFFPSKAKAPQPQLTVIQEESKTEASATPAAPTTPAPLTGNVLARVGSWTLTKEEFKEKLNSLKDVLKKAGPEAGNMDVADPKTQKLVLNELVNQQLLIQDAMQKGYDKRKEISDAIDEFRKTILVREVAAKVSEGIEVTDQEVLDFYNQNKDQFFATAPSWHVREIVVPTEDDAKAILIEILKGADFATTAQTRSKSKSAEKGGDLGFISEPVFPQMNAALLSLEVGQASSVFKGPDGFYIIKLEEKKSGEPAKFESVNADIKNYLMLSRQQQTILSHIEDLKKKNNVQLNESLLDK